MLVNFVRELVNSARMEPSPEGSSPLSRVQLTTNNAWLCAHALVGSEQYLPIANNGEENGLPGVEDNDDLHDVDPVRARAQTKRLDQGNVRGRYDVS